MHARIIHCLFSALTVHSACVKNVTNNTVKTTMNITLYHLIKHLAKSITKVLNITAKNVMNLLVLAAK